MTLEWVTWFNHRWLLSSISDGGGPAHAQVGDLLNKAEGASGALGTAAKLGTTITDMQKNVDGLNQNIKVLNEVKAALGG